ncbi:MAG: protein-L-isoaspartate O-methyltransferase [Patescibacteria group bacterium]
MDLLIKELIAEGVLKSAEIMVAFRAVDRADFVRAENRPLTYENIPLPIGAGQTISQPYTVAFMLELLQARAGDRVLDIGAGSGWQTALLAEIVGITGKVFAVELLPELFEFGKNNVSKYDFIKNGIVKFYCQNAQNGLPAEAPFDKIISAAASDIVSPAWKTQLKTGGRMVLPIGNSVRLIVKKDADNFEEFIYSGFAFVPFVAK